MAQTLPLALDLELPWQSDHHQEKKFQRILQRILIVLLLLFIIIPWLPVFQKEYEERKIDIVKTEIVLTPIVVTPEPTPVQAPQPAKAKPKEKPVTAQKVAPKPADPKVAVKEEKKQSVAKEQGLTQISSQLDSLRQSLDLTKLQKKNVSTSDSGKVARADSTVLGTSSLTQKGAGIKVDDTMMRSENVALAAHESTKMDGFMGDDSASGTDSSDFYSDLKGRRSDESIRRVFEAGKSKAYMYYLRALRETPGLSGTFVFEVVIEPNGKISGLKMVSSELDAPDLESKILDNIKQLDFGAQDVAPRRLTYKFNFLPS